MQPFGFHLSDGAQYTLSRGDEYEDIAAAWDWNLIPGITIDYGATSLDCGHTAYAGIESFVGGVSDGRVGIAVMRYTNPYTQSLHFQKAWFFLKDDVQMTMISNISSSTTAPVYSVLDQRRRNGTILVNDIEQLRNFTGGVQSLWHGGVGYTFQATNGMNLSVQVGNTTGNWSALGVSTQPPATIDLFTAWLTHDSLNMSVAYTAFPGTDPTSFQAKRDDVDIQIVQNDDSISAISDAANQQIMVAFWGASGGVVNVSTTTAGPMSLIADRGVAILFNTKTGNITVSDPSQSLVTVNVTIVWHASVNNMFFCLPQGGLAGSSVSQNIRDV